MIRWTKDFLKIALKLDIPFPLASHNLCIDTRQLQRGDIFIAIKGDKDGHSYVKHALEQGATCAIVDHTPGNISDSSRLIHVDDTLKALTSLGTYGRSIASKLKAIAVTGSVGKTTTKEMLRSTLHYFGPTIYSKASYNNHLGVPLSLALLGPDSKYGVFEVGMNHIGEIAPLAKIVEPDIAIITTVSPSHIGNMGSLEAIVDEKCQIFAGLRENGIAMVHGDHPLFNRMQTNAKAHGVHNIFTVGRKAGLDARLLHYQPVQQGTKSLVTAEIFGKIIAYPLQFAGDHYAFNSLYVLLTAEVLGIDLGETMQQLAKVQPVIGRGQIHNLQLANGLPIFVFDDAYNANPTSMTAGLKSFCTMQHAGKRIAIIGQMGELGEYSDTYHIEIAQCINTLPIDCVHVVGTAAKCLYQALNMQKQGNWFATVDGLKENFVNELNGHESIFLKGSFSQKLPELVALLKNQLREVA
jgi:UDP-N-acetylmuramoyl-tripeptide--D-alanyl-D-alanine ligase